MKPVATLCLILLSSSTFAAAGPKSPPPAPPQHRAAPVAAGNARAGDRDRPPYPKGLNSTQTFASSSYCPGPSHSVDSGHHSFVTASNPPFAKQPRLNELRETNIGNQSQQQYRPK